MQKLKYAPKLPLELDTNGEFLKIESKLENVKQKLKTIILTNPGEKLMDPEFGVGINRYLFEPNVGIVRFNRNNEVIESTGVDDFNETISRVIRQQVLKYDRDIVIEEIQTEINDEKLYIEIFYNYKNIISDSIIIEAGA